MSNKGRTSLHSWIYAVLMVYVLAAGAILRYSGLLWGEFTFMHPDERFLLMVGSDLSPTKCLDANISPQACPPERKAWLSLNEYFDTAHSSLNPHNRGYGFYVYGTLPMYLARYGVEWVYKGSGLDAMTKVGRALSALFDLGTVLLIFLVAERLYDRRVGVLAAAFMAFAVLPIQQSHFFTMDTFVTFFMLLTVYFAVRVLVTRLEPPGASLESPGNGPLFPPEGRGSVPVWFRILNQWLRHPYFWLSVGFGIALGLAVASKITAAPLAILLPGALLIGLIRLPVEQQRRRAVEALVFLALAAAFSLVTFRICQPHAFTGPGFFGVKLNPAWLQNLKELRNQASGDVDFPPAVQWARRPVWFALTNMVLWGMGLPLGLLAWTGFLWAGWRIIKGQWQRHILIWGWTALYFIWQSLPFNPTMRYQLPIYPTLAIFAAWAIFALYDLGVGYSSGPGSNRAEQPAGRGRGWLRALAVVTGAVGLLATAAYAYAFVSNVYEQPFTRVAGSRWMYQNIPGPINFRVQTADGLYNQPQAFPQGFAITRLVPYAASFEARRSGTLAEVFLAHVVDQQATPGETALFFTISNEPNRRDPLATASLSADLAPQGDPRGAGYTLTLDRPVELEQGKQYYIELALASDRGAVILEGASVAVEGAWDDGLPLRVDEYDGYGGLYTGVGFDMYEDDNPSKLARYFTILDEVDYLTISSSRQWGSLPRIPERFPMNTAYYRFLLGCPAERTIEWCYSVAEPGMFTGQLGFDLVAIFQSDPKIGPIRFNSQFAEEAFTVYDHPKVLIFQKRPDYSSVKMQSLLMSVDLSQVVHVTPRRAGSWRDRIFPVDLNKIETNATKSGKAVAPSMLLPPERLASQYAGGTWSEIFDTQAWHNRWPFLGLVLWYFAIGFLGLLAYPVVRIALGGLPDHGYPLARIAGLLIISYLVWLGGSFGIPATRLTISLVVLLLALVAGLLAFWQRAEIRRDWEQRGRYILLIEGLFLAFFTFDLLIRLGNPDLWHPWKGGERPMDFSYFNAVLKSTTFPPYDPWFSGGYINYYYYGFVLVGVLVKWLGIVPSIAFNLILPTVFALIAVGAFSLGWNLIEATRLTSTRGRRSAVVADPISSQASLAPGVEGQSLTSEEQALFRDGSPAAAPGLAADETEALLTIAEESPLQAAPAAAPEEEPAQWVSRHLALTSRHALMVGIAAALGMALLGNLGTLRMIFHGYQRLAAPNGNIEGAGVITRWIWTAQGLVRTLQGASLPYGLADWYWIPSRAIPAPNEVEPITEFPFFTVLYGDPHAHLFAMPLAVLALGWALAMVLGRSQLNHSSPAPSRLGRSALRILLSFLLGGMVIGALWPTNTWDLPTYLALGAAAIAYSAAQFTGLDAIRLPFLSPKVRRTAAALAGILLLVGLTFLLFQPYAQWYVPGYTSVEQWKGTHTPVWSYLTHWGLFLFVIVSWLTWETRDWMVSTPLSALRKLLPYKGLLLGTGAVLLVWVVGLLYLKVSIAWLALPLAAWSGVLLLRPELPAGKRAVLFMVGTGLVLTIMVEIIVLKGDISRMNTVFKFYLQVWTLFAISAAAALGWIWADLEQWTPNWRTGWQLALAALAAAAALYPLLGGMAKVKDRMTTEAPHTLDGMAFMQVAKYDDMNTVLDLSQDYRAIRWMQENVVGSPVIVEANQVEYHWGTRYTVYTGLPNVVGWNWHQRQQRARAPEGSVERRVNEVNQFYQTTVPEQARDFLQKYSVRYIVVGQLERALYPGQGLQKFDLFDGSLWNAVYQDGDTAIYLVNNNP